MVSISKFFKYYDKVDVWKVTNSVNPSDGEKMQTPAKPFNEYKWQWATFMCTEGINEPTVFIGVLRALRKNEGKNFSSQDFWESLKKVEKETNKGVSLARSRERNIMRNSGQYWKALGLLKKTRRGKIELTDFGRKFADGDITKTEFAITVIKSLELPNKNIEQNASPWESAGLIIKPLELILSIISELFQSYGPEEGYLTPDELIKLVIPLSGIKSPLSVHIEAIIGYRSKSLNVDSWCDCAPKPNDRRMAREFLLYLFYYGFCKREDASANSIEKYYLNTDTLSTIEIDDINNIDNFGNSVLETLDKIEEKQITSRIERRKVLIQITERPQQTQFRREILDAFNSTCLLTGVQIPDALEAAHIVPVNQNGADTIDNGICLRSDIHRLFDSGHLRIDSEGNIHLSDKAKLPTNYANLPHTVELPPFMSLDNIQWRWNYD